VGGVIGPLDAPRVLLLGRLDRDGHLRLVGRTTELPPAGRNAVAARLRLHTGSGHPWLNPLPSTRWGQPGAPTAYTPVRPDVVVELLSTPRSSTTAGATLPTSSASVRTCAAGDLIPLPPIPASTPQPRRVQPGSARRQPAWTTGGWGRCGEPSWVRERLGVRPPRPVGRWCHHPRHRPRPDRSRASRADLDRGQELAGVRPMPERRASAVHVGVGGSGRRDLDCDRRAGPVYEPHRAVGGPCWPPVDRSQP
jgi:hypothetical protein